MGDSDTRVSHSEALLNYCNMLGKGKQTVVGLWAADNFLGKDKSFGVLQAVRENVLCSL